MTLHPFGDIFRIYFIRHSHIQVFASFIRSFVCAARTYKRRTEITMSMNIILSHLNLLVETNHHRERYVLVGRERE